MKEHTHAEENARDIAEAIDWTKKTVIIASCVAVTVVAAIAVIMGMA